MRTHILIAALILSTSATAQAAGTRGLIVKQPPAVQQPAAVETPAYQTQAAPVAQPLESVALQTTAPQPAQHMAINGTHRLPTAQAQPQASQRQMQMQAQQQQMQRKRMQQMQAQRMRQQQEMQQHEMQRQQMARNMSFEEKVDYKVKEVKTKLKEKLVGALLR